MTQTLPLTQPANAPSKQRSAALDEPEVPGPPTLEELMADYQAKFTWEQLKRIISYGDLGLLKRDNKLQERYMIWSDVVRRQHDGDMKKYLTDVRLNWGHPDTICKLPSSLPREWPASHPNGSVNGTTSSPNAFTRDLPFDSPYLSIIINDWPYSVPPEVEHALIWTRLPFLEQRIEDDDGLWGLTGTDAPRAADGGRLQLSDLDDCLEILKEWGVKREAVKDWSRPSSRTPEEQEMLDQAAEEVGGFVKRLWPADGWETAWFVNPPRLQSVPGLAHAHVFARRK
ncbi:hypothetical protein CONPUDRAFT_113308 [Coniophora puteana RWD-64-598 SS2]|uniref:Uncharacterized protein n=1 Tax=Coniophora puteana (strain RWD-64-598) TaxID=741705 RepID=R7SEX4_CONPW|nr:uncharacterized protein CONPUDRAFT_113308 [Coniophora puteana RWD-64-598 SS2]EIW74721.1 hypothetical protein CONPUDRAFT_113308 [Coniophora puteana RWD-64-598 SS2]